MSTPTRDVILKTHTGVPYVPMAYQRVFHEAAPHYKVRAFVSGLGPGKTLMGCIETALNALLHPGSVQAVVRFDQNRLRTTTFATLLGIFENTAPALLKRVINSPQESVIELVNGSEVRGTSGKDWRKLGSWDLSAFFIDEASELPDDELFLQCVARLRNHIGPRRGIVCSLPDGHNWLWQRLVRDAALHPDHKLFRARTWDNPYLPNNYADDLKRLYGPERALVMLAGSFDSCAGRILEMFDPRLHVLPRRPLPREWYRYAAVDPGFSPDPCAMLRAAVDPHGNIVIEQEYHRTGRVTEQWSADILSLNQAHPPLWYVIDPSADRQTHAAPVSVIDTARRAGLTPIRAGNNDVDQSVGRLRSLLTPDPEHCHPFSGEKGAPRLYVFDDCARTIWELQNWRLKKQGAASALKGLKPQDHDDDLVSCLRYLCLEHLTPASPTAPPPLSAFWQQLLNDPTDPLPYIQQCGARPRGR